MTKRSSLAAATLGLLGIAPAHAQADLPSIPVGAPAGETPKWEFDTGVLVYSETGGRVQAVEPVVKATRDLGDDRKFTAKLVVDTLTGASPNGATPASTPQTFSSPSGGGSAAARPFETPLDDTFKDTRVALSADYLFPLGDDSRLDLGLNGSKEFDYTSFGASANYALELFQNNTTLNAGLSFSSDTISAVGGAPTPLALMLAGGEGGGDDDEGEEEDEDEDSDSGGGQNKAVVDVVLGLTQVLDPVSLVQFNYSLSESSGYHNDPYKILSVVGVDGEPIRYVYESRPDSRAKHALFARYKRFMFSRDVLDVSYRIMADDWGVRSDTFETLYRWNLDGSNYLEPHLRWYTQTAADFYRAALFDGEETTVDHASADPRLGAFTGITAGLKYGHTLRSGNQWSVRGEFYRQTGEREGIPDPARAGLSKFDVEPDLSAAMLTFGYRFKW